MKKSLFSYYTKRWEVVVMILGALGLLTTGLSLPVFYVQKFVLWNEDYSIWKGVVVLIEGKAYILATIVFFFSIVFPYGKLLVLTSLWFIKVDESDLERGLHWLKLLGKWSMLDVFVVAILVVMNKTGGPLKMEPRIGIYLFGAAIILSTIATAYVDRLAKKVIKNQG